MTKPIAASGDSFVPVGAFARELIRQPVAELIAQALHDAKVGVVTNVPGFGGSQVFSAYHTLGSTMAQHSFHEEVAFSVGHGASLTGTRAATLIKSHGLLKAANAVADSLAAGTTAGYLLLVFDDKSGAHSDSILNSEAMLQGLGIPYQLAQAETAYRTIRESFVLSEQLQLPLAVLIEVESLEQHAPYLPEGYATAPPRYERNPAQNLVCPWLSRHQHEILQEKLAGRNWRALAQPDLPLVPDSFSPAVQKVMHHYMALFEVFKQVRGEVVTGDTSISTLFAFPPYSCIDLCTHLGGSLPLAIGAYHAGYQNVWALTGDFSFLAAGHLGLIEALQHNVPLRVLLFHNGRAESTGGQAVSEEALAAILAGYGPFVRSIRDPQDSEEVDLVLSEASQAAELRIVVADFRSYTE